MPYRSDFHLEGLLKIILSRRAEQSGFTEGEKIMRMCRPGRSGIWKGIFLGAAVVLTVSNLSIEKTRAAGLERSNAEQAYISESDAALQEQSVAKAEEQEAIREQTAGDAVQDFVRAVREFTVQSRDDTQSLLALDQMYEKLNEEEKGQVSSETLTIWKEAQNQMAALNHKDQDVWVEGDIPWYVQFSAVMLADEGKINDSTWIVVPYEMELRDGRNGEVYKLSEGESVTVTMPVPNTLLRGKFVIYHYKSDGTVETIAPHIQGDTMSFEATSFSMYSVAGSSVVAGIGITTEFNFPDEGRESETSSNNNSDETESEDETEKSSKDQTTEKKEDPGKTSDTEKSGNISGTENKGGSGNTPETDKIGKGENTPGTEKNSNYENVSSTEKKEDLGNVSQTGNSENTSSTEKTGNTDSMNGKSGTQPSAQVSGTRPQTNTDNTPQNDPSVQLAASPALTGDGTNALYLLVLGMAALLVLAESVVMKKKIKQ